MITLRKLASLPQKTALRKAASLLQGLESDLVAGRVIDAGYLAGLVRFVTDSNLPGLTEDFRQWLGRSTGSVMRRRAARM